ncbi:MAG: hypothetical protein GKR94_11855 [Gammaproteobacteria bacterium]|nr:hypothetical protein [Gammaproteobacteria bacterium]
MDAMPSLRARGGRPELWMLPDDAAEREVADGGAARIFNEHGELFVVVRAQRHSFVATRGS